MASTFRKAQHVLDGLALGAIGFGVLTAVGSDSGLAVLVSGYAVASVAVGLVTTLTTDLIIGAAPPERAGGYL